MSWIMIRWSLLPSSGVVVFVGNWKEQRDDSICLAFRSFRCGPDRQFGVFYLGVGTNLEGLVGVWPRFRSQDEGRN